MAEAKTPNPDMLVEVGHPIGIMDLEFSIIKKGDDANVHEAAVVLATYEEGGWVVGEATFHVVVKGKVAGWTAKNCPRLAVEAGKSIKTFIDMFMELIAFIKTNKIKWLKAHNGIPADFLTLYQQARRMEIPDPLLQLEEAGLLGFIDPGRFIPFHKITDLQQRKMGKGGEEKFSGYLSNEYLFRMAAKMSMEQSGLTPHRALDDAKAERTWLIKLPQLEKVLFGSASRLQCGISLANFRVYAEQSVKHKAAKRARPNA